MPQHANYAAVFAITRDTIHNLVRGLYHDGKIPSSLVTEEIPRIKTNLFLDMPIVSLSPTENKLSVDIQAWGSMEVASGFLPPEEREVLLQATFLLTPVILLVNKSLVITFEAFQTVLSSLKITLISGGPYSRPVQSYLRSDEFHTNVKNGVSALLFDNFDPPPTFPADFLLGIADAWPIQSTLVILENVIVVGFDVNDATTDVRTVGNREALADVTNQHDIALWINPAVFDLYFRPVYDDIREKASEDDAEIDSLSIETRNGFYYLSGSGNSTGGYATFSMRAHPKLFRPGVVVEEYDEEYGEHYVRYSKSRNELWFKVSDIEIDIDRAWWFVLGEVVLGTISLGIIAAYIEKFIRGLRLSFVEDINAAGDTGRADCVQDFILYENAESVFQLRLAKYECYEDATFTGILLTPKFHSSVRISGREKISIEDVIGSNVIYRVNLPYEAKFYDPQLKVRWTVRRDDNNEILISKTLRVLGNLTISLAELAPLMLETFEFTVECRLFRELGTTTMELFNGSVHLTVTDVLDRSHPFVMWNHQVFTPNVVKLQDGSRRILGYNLKTRKSRIHRTDFPGRCIMASRYSSTVLKEENPSVPRAFLEYLDELPFPMDELASYRNRICDYCFFGGPTKDELLI